MHGSIKCRRCQSVLSCLQWVLSPQQHACCAGLQRLQHDPRIRRTRSHTHQLARARLKSRHQVLCWDHLLGRQAGMAGRVRAGTHQCVGVSVCCACNQHRLLSAQSLPSSPYSSRGCSPSSQLRPSQRSPVAAQLPQLPAGPACLTPPAACRPDEGLVGGGGSRQGQERMSAAGVC
jgi:hypothetical protein